jgi:hypothetical protein
MAVLIRIIFFNVLGSFPIFAEFFIGNRTQPSYRIVTNFCHFFGLKRPNDQHEPKKNWIGPNPRVVVIAYASIA